jgi:membrane protease YdiL (CAAX protease family)
MTAIPTLLRSQERSTGRAWAEAALIAAGLGAIVTARAAATRAGADPLVVGAGFGLGLGGLAVVAGGFSPPRGGALAPSFLAGVALGLALVAAGSVGGALGGAAGIPGLGRPSAPFAPWALITVLVAAGEEGVLRGTLFDRLRRTGGTGVALLATTILFALMHVPLYGWHVVPLDLAVGLSLGGLRIATRGIVAPAVAHAVADLATWWL